MNSNLHELGTLARGRIYNRYQILIAEPIPNAFRYMVNGNALFCIDCWYKD